MNDLTRHIGKTPTGYDFENLGDVAYSDAEQINYGHAKQYNLELLAGYLRYEGDRRLTDNVSATGPKGAFQVDTGCWRREHSVARIGLSQRLGSIAGQLLGAQTIAYYDDQMFVKRPGTRQRTAFHQDYPFFHLEGNQGCVFWVPVDPVNTRNGGMSYVRGSHKSSVEYAVSMFISHTKLPGSFGEQVPDIEANPDQYDLISFDVEPGDVVIHHFKTLHGSGGNRTLNRQRRAMSYRYVGEQMRFKNKMGAPHQPHHTHTLQDGDPLWCADFPIIWQRDLPGDEERAA